METVVLLSGGKDSCFNARECAIYGHKLVALANLRPAAGAGERPQELDSMMFQTVGHTAIEAISTASGLPLFRVATGGHSGGREEVGFAVDASLASRHDEIADMHALLAAVKKAIPTVEAVACGAILSTYQRTRVEAACSQLGLVPLAFLWQCRQPRLLRRMVASGMDSVLVKVSSMGLKVRFLGQSIAELEPQLQALGRSGALNVCGEGGEYETLTRCCSGLFRPGCSVRFGSTSTAVVSADELAPVARLEVADCVAVDARGEVVPAGEAAVTDVDFDEEAAAAGGAAPAAAEAATLAAAGAAAEAAAGAAVARVLACHPSALLEGGAAAPGPALFLSNVVAPASSRGGAVEAEARGVLERLRASAAAAGCQLDDALNVHLFVDDMAEFGRINAVYTQFFSAHTAPSRSCVQVDRSAAPPEGVAAPPVRLRLDAAFLRGSAADTRGRVAGSTSLPTRRSILHVRSRSRWAPLCIGPYSQANECGGVLWMAGQIALAPAVMALSRSPPTAEAAALYEAAVGASEGAAALRLRWEADRAMLNANRALLALRADCTSSLCSCVAFVAGEPLAPAAETGQDAETGQNAEPLPAAERARLAAQRAAAWLASGPAAVGVPVVVAMDAEGRKGEAEAERDTTPAASRRRASFDCGEDSPGVSEALEAEADAAQDEDGPLLTAVVPKLPAGAAFEVETVAAIRGLGLPERACGADGGVYWRSAGVEGCVAGVVAGVGVAAGLEHVAALAAATAAQVEAHGLAGRTAAARLFLTAASTGSGSPLGEEAAVVRAWAAGWPGAPPQPTVVTVSALRLGGPSGAAVGAAAHVVAVDHPACMARGGATA